jgi:hypothetical protein
MNLPKTVSVDWMRNAKVGDSIICQGHTSYCRTPLQKAGFKYTTHKGWLNLLTGEAPSPVTVLTITELGE